MRLLILSDAEDDLLRGYEFYEAQRPGLGLESLEHLDKAILGLRSSYERNPRLFIHFRRALVMKRFPFAIYYDFDESVIRVHMIFDCRRDPALLHLRLRTR